MTGALNPNTLGDLIDGDYQLRVYCEQRIGDRFCGHNEWLDLEAAAARLGRDHSSMHDDLTPKLRCSKCGAKNMSLRLHPQTVRKL